MQDSRLYVDRFCPKKLENFVLPERIKNEMKEGVHNHLLFYGSSGLGKSALAKMLAKQHIAYKYINASHEGRMEVLRNDIFNFCSEVQINTEGEDKYPTKVVILDEIDGVSLGFWDALKGFMDTFQEGVRFVATTNYINKIDPHVADRFEQINFNFIDSEEEAYMRKQYGGYMKQLATKALKKKFDDDAVKYLVDKDFPSFRGGLKTLQRLDKAGVEHITLKDIKTKAFEFIELYELILSGKGEPEDIYKMLHADYMNKSNDVMDALDHNFVDYIMTNKVSFARLIPRILITVADYQAKTPFVIDPSITMRACVFKLMEYTKQMQNSNG